MQVIKSRIMFGNWLKDNFFMYKINRHTFLCIKLTGTSFFLWGGGGDYTVVNRIRTKPIN